MAKTKVIKRKKVNGYGFLNKKGELYMVEMWNSSPKMSIPVTISYSLNNKRK